MHGLQLAWFEWRRRLAAAFGGKIDSVTASPRLLPIGLIPGYGFAVRGNPIVALIALGLWLIAAIVLLLYIGETAANYATAQMVGIHALGLACALHRDVFLSTRRDRIRAQVLGVFLLVVLVYFPAFHGLRQLVFPLETAQGMVVLNALTRTGSLERGDVVGYAIRRQGYGNIRLRSGYGFDPVLALPGDRIAFFEDFIEVNGQRLPRHGTMPRSGEVVVPEKHWYIWPSSIRGGGPEEFTTQLMTRAAVVPRSRIIGKPYTRWLWRKQTYEPVQ